MSDYEYIRPDGPFAMLCPSDRVSVLEQQISRLNAVVARLRAENETMRAELAEFHEFMRISGFDAPTVSDGLRAMSDYYEDMLDEQDGAGHTFRVNANGQVESGPGVDWRKP
jgi:hypothetical protein